MPQNLFVVHGATVFDGLAVRRGVSVLVVGSTIADVRNHIEPPAGVTVIDGRGRTLLPGLIDAHTHAKPPVLRHAIAFGVTTEFDMSSVAEWMRPQKTAAARQDDMADVLSSYMGVTVHGGHPSFLVGTHFDTQFPTVNSIGDVPDFVARQVVDGADYIKIFIEDGTALGYSCPTLSTEMISVATNEAHRHGKMALAHVTSLDAFDKAVDARVDGVTHLFADAAPSRAVVERALTAGIFAIPTLSTLAAVTKQTSGQALAHDSRVQGLLPRGWRENMCRVYPARSPSRWQHAIETVRRFNQAGVPILAGTDAACIGAFGTAHGASLHGELQLLVEAGLSPTEALQAATARPAEYFGLRDRGRIAVGYQADLVLVRGDPTVDISDTLSIEQVWRRGSLLARRRIEPDPET